MSDLPAGSGSDPNESRSPPAGLWARLAKRDARPLSVVSSRRQAFFFLGEIIGREIGKWMVLGFEESKRRLNEFQNILLCGKRFFFFYSFITVYGNTLPQLKKKLKSSTYL